jgi:hypothetical protein
MTIKCNIVLIEPRRHIFENLKEHLEEVGHNVVASRDSGAIFDLDASGELKNLLSVDLPMVIIVNLKASERLSPEEDYPPRWSKSCLPTDEEQVSYIDDRFAFTFMKKIRSGAVVAIDQRTPVIIFMQLHLPGPLEKMISEINGPALVELLYPGDIRRGQMQEIIEKLCPRPRVTMIEECPIAQPEKIS